MSDECELYKGEGIMFDEPPWLSHMSVLHDGRASYLRVVMMMEGEKVYAENFPASYCPKCGERL